MYLFEDLPEPSFIDPVIVAAGLAALVATAIGLWRRRSVRRRPARGPAYQVFREDVATALLFWGVAELAFTAGWLLRIEGLRMPIWSYLGAGVGVAIGFLVWRRERRSWPALAKTDGVEQLADGSIQRGVSQTWEMGILLAGGAGLGSYLAAAGHGYGHPIHWVITGLMLLGGFALGVTAWTPRFKLTTVRAKRHPTTDPDVRRATRPARRPSGRRKR